jgi:hypothetical protein
MSISNYAELKILDHLTGTAAWTAPTDVYLKLHLGNPGEDATANPAAETDRKEVTFGAAASGEIVSDAVVEWTNVSTTEAYTHWSLWDNLTAGNPLWYGALSATASVTAGDTFQITSLTLTLD